MSLTTYPLNRVDYTAEDAELFHCTRNSGVFSGEDFSCSVTGSDNVVTVGDGVGWIRNSKFSGKVVALKESTSVDLGVSDATYPRIDAVVLRFDIDANATNVIAKNGTPSSTPLPPEVTRTESVYELHLCHVRREAGETAISVSNVKDTRLDPAYCGLMADSITSIDTTVISTQINELIENLENKIKEVGISGVNALLESGPLVLSENQYGYQLPQNPVDGQFFVLIKE